MQEALREGLALAQKVSKPPPPMGCLALRGWGGGLQICSNLTPGKP